MSNRKSNESILNPLTWCDPEAERTTLLEYSSSPKLDLNVFLFILLFYFISFNFILFLLILFLFLFLF